MQTALLLSGMEAGEMEGVAGWLRIVKAIEKLVSQERPDDAEVH